MRFSFEPGDGRAALAGVSAGVAWLAVEPLACRLTGSPMTTPRLLGAPLGTGRRGTAAGAALHLANAAVAGVAFGRLGIRGWKQGLVAAQVEGALLWPAMAVVDRVHPDRRDGTWPPLLTSGRTFAKEAVVHAVFGAALGALLEGVDVRSAGPVRRRRVCSSVVRPARERPACRRRRSEPLS